MSTITAGQTVATRTEKVSLRRFFEWGGFAAGAVLVAFGIVAILMGVDGRSTVHESLAAEKIVGTPNMTVADVTKEAQEAGVAGIALPTKSIAGEPIDTGAKAKTFAEYVRAHAMMGSGGLTYAEMGRFAAADGAVAGTNDPAAAAKDEQGNPLPNTARNTWVTATALTTALNVSFMAEQLALFGIVVGVALLLSGIGFIVLAYAALHRRNGPQARAA